MVPPVLRPKAKEIKESWSDSEEAEEDTPPVPTHGAINISSERTDAGDDDSDSPSSEGDDEGSDLDGSSASEEDEDDSDEDENYFKTILNSYRKLPSRRVDLVGDYAGNELFFIDGDSLLLQCFSDERLDFGTGFQMLHAIYNVEYFLRNLASRKCNFHIVFFHSNKALCVPPATSRQHVSKYLLARAAIIRHLQVNLQASHRDIEIEEFSSYTCSDFATYLARKSPYFIMAHDGALPSYRKGKHSKLDLPEAPQESRAALRELVLFFIIRGYNVALINGLECRDTKVMTMVLEKHSRAKDEKRLSKAFGTLLPSMNGLHKDEVKYDFERVQGLETQITEAQLLAVFAIGESMLKSDASASRDTRLSLASAFLMHKALQCHLPLSARRMPSEAGNTDSTDFLDLVAQHAESILYTQKWRDLCLTLNLACDVSDFIDGRLLNISGHSMTFTADIQSTYRELCTALKILTGLDIPANPTSVNISNPVLSGAPSGTKPTNKLSVMPFSNAVFDKHLAAINIQVDENAEHDLALNSYKIFREVTHWHNAKKPLIQKGQPSQQSAKEEFWAAKRNQFFMSDMQKYAASLTNAVGRSLEPETIISGVSKPKYQPLSASENEATNSGSEESSSSGPRHKVQPKKGGGGKTAQKNAGKQAFLSQIAADHAKKEKNASDKIINSWHAVCKDCEADKDPRARYKRAKEYLVSLSLASSDIIATECQLYMLSCLLHFWITACRNKEKDRHMEVAALIWNVARGVAHGNNLTKEIVSNVDMTVKTLGLPPVSKTSTDGLPARKLPFTFALPAKTDALSVDISSLEFQLMYCGPYMERSFDSKPDPRVDFHPDGWQRRVLDGIDANKSVFAVAPTSAGKTFISFYAMRKVLEADEHGVLVYVAPTKALVNQIAAEIQARFSKKFKHGGKSVWAIHTRDYRINNATGCQILVTVPHVLQIMLLAPTNANSWSSRVKRIIFDEVHSIGQAEDGVVWEQLLLLAPCPIIALSATVGNPSEFSDWLASTQKAIGVDLVTVQHPHRYSDLRKYHYMPPSGFVFQGLPDRTSFGTLGLEHAKGINHIHPVAALVDRSRGIPEDLALEPRDCYELFTVMAKYATDQHPVSPELDPKIALPEVVKKVDIIRWERNLKALLQRWVSDARSPYLEVVRELERGFRDAQQEAVQETRPTNGLGNSTLALLCRLQEQDALPAILFNYDRHLCEDICQTVMEDLRNAELEQQKSGPSWQKKLEKWEEWKRIREKMSSRNSKAAGKKAGNKKGDGDQGFDDGKTSKMDDQQDIAGSDSSSWNSFDPEAPVDGYHFADYTRVLLSEMDVYVRQLRSRKVLGWLIEALQRGIGVHHAGMNRKYRQVVEILFRKGFLRVIVATGTLALGINMPCKTVVFSGDSVFLTALNYRQCSGRAGRRGFDLLGNVVFQDVSREKVCRLVSSRLPDLNGHFPITTTLVLRLFTLLHASKSSKYATSAINALLSQPRLYMGGPSFKDQAMHHLRFSIEYLRRQHLLSPNGAPLNFAGLVSHLYFTENSSFAFHALLKGGYFHELCGKIRTNEKTTLETLMLVMAHLFNRIYCRQSSQEYKEKVVKPSSSIVFLPPMPAEAASILEEHNHQILEIYRIYVETFVDQHIHAEDRKLPLTGLEVGADKDEAGSPLPSLAPTKIRSAFVALSGTDDKFENISDLCETTRDGVFLEEAVIPYVGVDSNETGQPLNAWLLDFFKHGDIYTLERANGVRRADVWFLLNDFSLVLATIIASLMGLMKLKEGTDMDMLDVMGNLDAHEDAEDEEGTAAEQQSVASGPSMADSAISMPELSRKSLKKKAKPAESWEDAADEEDAIIESETRQNAVAAAVAASLENPDEEDEALGLKDVLKAFTKLHAEFNVKFKAMWA